MAVRVHLLLGLLPNQDVLGLQVRVNDVIVGQQFQSFSNFEQYFP